MAMNEALPSTGPNPSTVLRLEGKDALGLLHRISTQSLVDLAPGEARSTLFCDFRGRLLHRAAVCTAEEGALWLVRDGAPGESLAAFIDRHVFRDDVRIVDHSHAWAVEPAPAPETSPGTWEERDGAPRLIHLAGWTLMLGSPRPLDPSWLAEHERSRIRLGRPSHGHEIVEDFNPFEVGLGGEVHLDKGCFTGQEALLRLITRRSVRRGLALLEGRGRPRAPSEIRVSGRRAGRLTSAIADPSAAEPGRWVGLAVLDRAVEAGPLDIEGCEPTGAPRFFTAPSPLGRPAVA